jgi:hypothetical protein
MHPEPTADALVQLVHRYYPAGIDVDDPRYESSEEAQRLTRVLQAAVEDTRGWRHFVQRLEEEFSDCAVWDTTHPWHDPCRGCRVSLPGFETGGRRYDAIVCLMSLLAPVYMLYASHSEEKGAQREHWTRHAPLPVEFHGHEVKLAGLIESTFGVSRLPDDVLFTPVPDLVPRTAHFGLGHARLVDCLFTRDRW